MKKYTLTIGALMMVLFAGSVFGQVMTACLTMEESQAKYNRDRAAGIVVRDTYTQQLQCHYQQLGVYWQQLHTSKQQAAKDLQQRQKDQQQRDKDAQQIATDLALAERLAALQLPTEKYDELVAFIEAIIPYVGDCSEHLKTELVRIHTNRSGHADGTSPGGQTHNINGFDNPGFLIAR